MRALEFYEAALAIARNKSVARGERRRAINVARMWWRILKAQRAA